MTTDIAVSAEVLDGLQSRLHGTLIRPGDPDYDAARHLWNGLIDKRPAAPTAFARRGAPYLLGLE
jgi:hypothetical protein